ncbi:MAG: HEAT repeat domain-containing protein, partial [Candidatus Heimdallarchaeaceae archaeon]
MPIEEENIENILSIILDPKLEDFGRLLSLDLFADHSKRSDYLIHLEPLLLEPSSQVRKKFAYILRKVASPLALKFLILLLDDEDSSVRQQAIQSLGFVGDKTIVPKLLEKLKDDNSLVRYEAAVTLTTLGWAPSNKEENMLFLFAREKWQELESIPDLPPEVFYPYLHDTDDNIRAHVVELLGNLHDENALDLLFDLLTNDSSYEVRELSSKAIANIGTKKSIMLLNQAALHDDWFVRKCVAES